MERTKERSRWAGRLEVVLVMAAGEVFFIAAHYISIQPYYIWRFLLLAAAPGEEEKGMTGVWEPLNQSGLWLHIAVPRSEVVRSLPAIQWVALVLACLYLLLIPALLLILNRRLLRPLLDIRRAMLKLGGGDQDYRLPEREPHLAREFNDIHRSFNQMAGSLHTLKIQNYEAALQKKELELKNLQLQIRPHFLLNTFNLIYSLAQLRTTSPSRSLSST